VYRDPQRFPRGRFERGADALTAAAFPPMWRDMRQPASRLFVQRMHSGTVRIGVWGLQACIPDLPDHRTIVGSPACDRRPANLPVPREPARAGGAAGCRVRLRTTTKTTT